MTVKVFVDGSYSEFCNVFPIKWRSCFQPREETVSSGRPDERTTGATSRFGDEDDDEDDDVHLMWVSGRTQFEPSSAAVARGKVDQKFYYRIPEGVASWEEVISAQDYPLYEHCRDSLTALTTKDVWRRFFSGESGRGIVMLGGGSASKDLILIRSVLAQIPETELLQYTIVDISNYMAYAARDAVKVRLQRDGMRQRVKLRTSHCDFMCLESITRKVRPTGKSVAWMIPGNTFGNLNEHEFMKSLSRAAYPGDLLVIGTEIIRESSRDRSIDTAARHYRAPEVQKFVRPALMAILHELGTAKSWNDLEKAVQVVSRSNNEHSSVPGATTIELMLPLEGRPPVTILISTKYEAIRLVEFVKRYEFKKEAIVRTRLSTQYKQFVFRFLPKSQFASSN